MGNLLLFRAAIYLVTAAGMFYVVQTSEQAWPAGLVLAILAELAITWGASRRLTVTALRQRTLEIIFAISLAVVAQLQPEAGASASGGPLSAWGAYLVIVGYAAGLIAWPRLEKKVWIQALFSQIAALWAIFLLAAIYNPPTALVCIFVWVSGYLVARALLEPLGDMQAAVMAAAWGLVAAELAWVFSVWLINYVVAGGILVIPLPALVIVVLAYSFAGIYRAQTGGTLSSHRFSEYMLVGAGLILLIVLGTKWSGGN